MSKVLVDESNLSNIGKAIRAKTGTTTGYKPSEMATQISNLDISPTYTSGTLSITSPDSFSLNVTQKEHQTITSALSSRVIQNADGSYSPAITDVTTVVSDTGYVPGTIYREADTAGKKYNVTASDATEIAGMVENGWAKVYEDGSSFYSDSGYTTKISSPSGKLLVCGMKSPTATSSVLDSNRYVTGYNNAYVTVFNNYFLCNVTALTEVYLPNLTKTGNDFISSCDNIEEIDLPNLTSVGNNFLFKCNKLKRVFLRSKTMCERTADLSYTTNATIYVPEALISNYKAATNWSSLSSNFETLESIKLTKLTIEGVVVINKHYTTAGVLSLIYNNGITLPEEKGVTWSITGNATISQDGVVTLTDSANSGNVLSVTVTSTYNSSISATYTISVVDRVVSTSIDLNNGQWVDTGTTIDGNKVYKSDSGSYNIANGKSTCTITVSNVSCVTVYLRSYGESGYDYAELGPLDGTVSRGSSSNVLSTKNKSSDTVYSSYTFNTPDTNTHTFQILYSKDSGGDMYDDRGYFYYICS